MCDLPDVLSRDHDAPDVSSSDQDMPDVSSSDHNNPDVSSSECLALIGAAVDLLCDEKCCRKRKSNVDK